MILYLDTSALVKLYLSEEGSEATRLAAAASDEKVTSPIAYAELRSALSRKLRMKELSEQAFRRHKSDFERDWEVLTKSALDRFTIRRAADLVELFPLKAYDAIHLASAEMVQQGARSAVTFACFDSGLSRSAAALGFTLLAGT